MIDVRRQSLKITEKKKNPQNKKEYLSAKN